MKRQIEIDILKCLGLFLVILAHVECPPGLFTIRSFDVPLMVFASGLAYAGRSSFPPYLDFCSKRCCRLVVPVMLFLVAYFILTEAVGTHYDVETVLRTFLLLDGIGYVWIIRVFLLLMLLTPFLCRLLRGNCKRGCILLIGAFLLYSWFMSRYCEHLPRIVKSYIPYMVGYAFVFSSALMFAMANLRWRTIQLLLWVVVTIGAIWVNGGFNPYSSKYPPYGLFIAYGISCSAALFMFCKLIAGCREKIVAVCNTPPRNGRVFCESFTVYISSHTIWIYLWHIPMLNVIFFNAYRIMGIAMALCEFAVNCRI